MDRQVISDRDNRETRVILAEDIETSKESKQDHVKEWGDPFEQIELEEANEDRAYQLSRDKSALESLGPPPQVRLYGFQATPKAILIVLTAVATLSAFLLGLDLTTINGAQLYLDPYMRLNTAEKSLVPSGIALGAMFGGAVALPFNVYLGRKPTILVSSFLYFCGALIQSLSYNFPALMCGRIIVGLGAGCGNATVPMYIAECSPKRQRGLLVAIFQLSLFLGQCLGYILAAAFASASANWRLMLGSGIVPALLQFILMIALPESPRWNLMKSRPKASFHSWYCIQGFEEDSRYEFFKMIQDVKDELKFSQNKNLVIEFIHEAPIRRICVVGCAMMFIQQFSGANAIGYYIGTVFESIGLSKTNAIYVSLVAGVANAVFCIPGLYWIDRVGRRKLNLCTLPGLSLSLLMTGLGFISTNHRTNLIITIIGVVFYYLFYANGVGLTPWVVATEVGPLYLRNSYMCLLTFCSYLGNFGISYTFNYLTQGIGTSGTFGLYAGFALADFVFILLFIPETKQKSLEELKMLFEIPTRIRVVRDVGGTWNAWKRAMKRMVKMS
ncbi:MFS transporter, SP family, sugar:H+ symporter [Galdieria sulphuraria]|uniref:MFS transporter, SP family, sugar:H+ symporter n=1 Tax=Galdieria sulphuraria TaxID=130081 RepID=M2XB18_GALSU|nr:MFS transporter, SP family, sugar:H+ symporter [Galdieria sulphuraria]EME27097.1 MFS transporter, SP family, sugar:H+ symporter [Galdieria sulphuraria]|eukprot:XP_005703617.1 MFS transporter, SP family, sugar:H+ symporter [Galdieria sulphuraria]